MDVKSYTTGDCKWMELTGHRISKDRLTIYAQIVNSYNLNKLVRFHVVELVSRLNVISKRWRWRKLPVTSGTFNICPTFLSKCQAFEKFYIVHVFTITLIKLLSSRGNNPKVRATITRWRNARLTLRYIFILRQVQLNCLSFCIQIQALTKRI